jgi:hypothetical protein
MQNIPLNFQSHHCTKAKKGKEDGSFVVFSSAHTIIRPWEE